MTPDRTIVLLFFHAKHETIDQKREIVERAARIARRSHCSGVRR